MKELFRKFALAIALYAGQPAAFLLATSTIILWAATGPVFGFSDTWQLVINTGTTIVTFLMVFLIQNTQNRDSKALQLKIDELVHAVKGARDEIIDLEDMSDDELERLEKQFKRLHDKASKNQKPSE